MKIRCWGARGSIPVSGRDYNVFGGDTTCIEIRTRDGEVIIIDAGSGLRRLGTSLYADNKNHFHMLFTHSHWDHVLGFPFFKPIYFKSYSIKMYGCPFAQKTIENFVSGVMKAPNFPVQYDELSAKITSSTVCEKEFEIGSVIVTPIPLSHPNQGLGFKFTEGNKSFVFLTDNELTFKHKGGLDFKDYRDFTQGADLLFHDSEYKPEEYEFTKTWGHSVYRDSLKLALEAGVSSFGLFHHNQDRTDAAVKDIVKDCKKTIKKEKSKLDCFAVSQGLEIQL